MVANIAQRNFSRCYYEFPIMFSDYKSDHFSNARTLNSSMDGMYFESDYALQPGFDIFIKKTNNKPDIDLNPEAYEFCRAKVIWCRRVTGEEVSKFGIGVQYSKSRNE